MLLTFVLNNYCNSSVSIIDRLSMIVRWVEFVQLIFLVVDLLLKRVSYSCLLLILYIVVDIFLGGI